MALEDLQQSEDGQLELTFPSGSSGVLIIGPYRAPVWPGKDRRDKVCRDYLIMLVSTGTLAGKLKLQHSNVDAAAGAEADRAYHDIGEHNVTESGSLEVLDVLGKYIRGHLELTSPATAPIHVTVRAV